MELFELLKSIASALLSMYDHDAAEIVAWDIAQVVTKKNRAELLGAKTLELTKEQKKLLRTIIERHRDNHEPLAYILGTMPFLDLIFKVRPPVLIPRSETEEWTSKLIAQLKKLPAKDQKQLAILDLCTGSGCIGISLAHAFPFAQIDVVDKAEHALALARENVEMHDIKNIEFFVGDLFDPLPKNKKYDRIVANPPYIDQADWNTLEPSVKNWEDYGALVAEDYGMYLVKKIIIESAIALKNDSVLDIYNIRQLWIEIGYNQGPVTLDFCKKSGYEFAKIIQDYMYVDRVLMASPGRAS